MILQERIEGLGSGILIVKKCCYTNKLNYKDMDFSILFNTEEELKIYLKNRFGKELIF